MPLIEEIAKDLRPGALVIALAIGVSTEDLEYVLPPSVDAARAMPNLAVEVRRGVTGLSAGANASRDGVDRIRWLFGLLGTVLEVPDERLDILSTVSGAGPAYVCLLLQEFTAAARRLGFDDRTASTLVRETFGGTLDLLDASGQSHSAVLAETAAPGSATERAIAEFAPGDIAEKAERAMRAAASRAEQVRQSIHIAGGSGRPTTAAGATRGHAITVPVPPPGLERGRYDPS